MVFNKMYENKIRPSAKNAARLSIIVKHRMDEKRIRDNNIFNKFFFEIYSKYKANGILIAIEKAVIFLFAVTPFNDPCIRVFYILASVAVLSMIAFGARNIIKK